MLAKARPREEGVLALPWGWLVPNEKSWICVRPGLWAYSFKAASITHEMCEIIGWRDHDHSIANCFRKVLEIPCH